MRSSFARRCATSPRLSTLALSTALSVVSALGATAARAQADDGAPRPRIALLDLQTSDDADKELATVLGTLLAERIARLGVFEVVTQDDIRRLISFERMKTALTCEDDASCLAEIGGALGARYVITGSVGRLDDQFVVALSFIDSETVETLGRETVRARSALALSSQIDDVLTRLTGPVLVEWRGTLALTSDDEGASIFIDDRAIGVVPMGPIALPAGAHRVSLSKDGYVSSLDEVVVPPKGRVALDVRLVPLAETYEALWWSAALLVSAGVAAGVAGALFIVVGGVGGALFAESVKAAGKPSDDGALAPTLVSDTSFVTIVAARGIAVVSTLAGAGLLSLGAAGLLFAEFPDEPAPAEAVGDDTSRARDRSVGGAP